MAKDKNDIYEKRAKKFLIISAIVIPVFVYLSIRLIFQEDICNKKAHQKVGSDWSKEVTYNGERITNGFMEQIKCEKGFRYLIP
jgi:hypothetical protein